MINIELILKDEKCIGFTVSGHAGYAEKGQDIVCAAVSATSQMSLIGIENLGIDFKLFEEDDSLSVVLKDDQFKSEAVAILESFMLFVVQLQKQYRFYITIKYRVRK